jgi:hypothetical protein
MENKMKSIFYTVFIVLALGISAASAGPTGVYGVEGQNPGDGSVYTGEVAVERTGATYVVVWRVGNDEYVGTGIGAANSKGMVTFGDAAGNDTAIAVSYVSGDTFGLALFVEQQNGQWKGIWTYGGSDAIGAETWTPR